MKTVILGLCFLILPAVHFAEEVEDTHPHNIVTVTPVDLRKLETMHGQAQRHIVAGQIRKAVWLYWEIILLEPDDDAAYTNLGHLYLILGDNGRAKDAFQNALHINPENESAQAGFLKITRPDEFPG